MPQLPCSYDILPVAALAKHSTPLILKRFSAFLLGSRPDTCAHAHLHSDQCALTFLQKP